jgi:signal transduction histidine kinase
LASKRKQTAAYIAVIAGCYALGMFIGWPNLSPFAIPIDNYASSRLLTSLTESGYTPQSVVVAVDEATLGARGGPRNYRPILAEMLRNLAAAQPKAVAIDITLHDPTDPADDSDLEAALQSLPGLVILPCDLLRMDRSEHWEDPLPRFAKHAARLGHVHRDQTDGDGINRRIQLEAIAESRQRWALALEAFSIATNSPIVQSPDDVQVGNVLIPAAHKDARRVYIRYLPNQIPRVSALEISQKSELIHGKTVFVGVTALAAARDRPVTPYGEIPGVEMHAQLYETLARGKFLSPVSDAATLLLCGLFAAAAGLIFALRSGWQAYVLGGVNLLIATALPGQFLRHDIVSPFFAPVIVAWLTTAGAATFQYFFVQRELKRSESEKSRYQQAIHWAAHEMRTPLTAIQGSSEIMTRYALPDDKRKQLSEMINSESKRLARLIQTFLDVERLAEGQMELKREPFEAAAVVDTCLRRVAPIAERKKIAITLDTEVEGILTGDRELMEYAIYNLLTNAVKYSPAETHVHVTSRFEDGELHLSIRDEGIGMDAKELKSIFKKFYRTKRAEASGEVGTGIGLSIVQQIVATHGGRIEVSSEPNKGSCFTMIVAAHAEASDRRG